MSDGRPTWLVTGGSGFLGQHLLDRIGREPVDVVAIGRKPLGDRPRVRSVVADLLDGAALSQALAAAASSVVFHLAGRTPPADRDALDLANRRATIGLLDALKEVGRPVRLVVAGSAAELGAVPVADLPVIEDHPCRPETDYGRSKLAATLAVLAAPAPIEAVVARVFNPIGPGLPATQALGRFAAMLGAIGPPGLLSVGDLTPRRDFIDARDVAEALVALGLRGRPGLYHVGTGRSHSVAEGLDELIRLSGLPVTIEVDPSRAAGPIDSRADIRRIRAETGWEPRIPFARSVADLWAASGRGRG